jgi:hypothetical protein
MGSGFHRESGFVWLTDLAASLLSLDINDRSTAGRLFPDQLEDWKPLDEVAQFSEAVVARIEIR